MNNWKNIDNKLVKDLEFADFNEAIDFINKVAEVAQKLDHHPEIINNYNKVTLKLSTHDAEDTITEKDKELAIEIDKISI
jgi:4a-hydroxytetrahydrobiopterin dehydratase